jgi:hypothetical protein
LELEAARSFWRQVGERKWPLGHSPLPDALDFDVFYLGRTFQPLEGAECPGMSHLGNFGALPAPC